jgi:hypothetical protein
MSEGAQLVEGAHFKNMSIFAVDEHLHPPTPPVVILVSNTPSGASSTGSTSRSAVVLVFTECSVVLVFFRLCTGLTVNTKCLRMLQILSI